ncbi:MAG: adenylate/guanylate cyclase domain-containing protein, partial [Ruegeria sp.]
MPRRLVAILAADVVGYSSLMEQDERGTLDRLLAFRKAVFDPMITEHSGRIVKLMGDGALVEFSSVTDAVTCAIAIQTRIASDENETLRLRIGVNLGDVIAEGGDIYGEGVNIAARLEAAAEPGGICISDIAPQGVGQRIQAVFNDGGTHHLKNIDQPIRLFHWAADEQHRNTDVSRVLTRTDIPGIAVLA